jgi:hypothetical protein
MLTIDRKEYELQLDGSGGGAFSGQSPSPDSAEPAPVIRIPLEQVALIYYREIPASAKKKPESVFMAGYPSLASIGAAEHGLDCKQLDLELARAGTIRWFPRTKMGAQPFTDHDALQDHGKNTGKYIGTGIVATARLLFAGQIPYMDYVPDSKIDPETWRWAVTAADRREVGLLRLKRDRHCPAQATPRAGITDQDILTKLEATRAALTDRQISDQEQMNQQTQLLDQLDPEMPLKIAADQLNPPLINPADPITPTPVRAPSDDGTVTAYADTRWFSSIDSARAYQQRPAVEHRGTLELTDQSLRMSWGVRDQANGGVRIPYSEIESVEKSSSGFLLVIVVRRGDGHVDSFHVGNMLTEGATTAAGELLRSKVEAQASASVSQ